MPLRVWYQFFIPRNRGMKSLNLFTFIFHFHFFISFFPFSTYFRFVFIFFSIKWKMFPFIFKLKEMWSWSLFFFQFVNNYKSIFLRVEEIFPQAVISDVSWIQLILHTLIIIKSRGRIIKSHSETPRTCNARVLITSPWYCVFFVGGLNWAQMN